jgi:hypothetical protein
MNISIRNNGWINGQVYSARWAEMGPDMLVLAVGSTAIQVPMALSGGTEVSVEAPNGLILGTDDVELRIHADLVLKLAANGRITVTAPTRDNTFSITTWTLTVQEPDPEPEPESQEEAEVES